jgi:hypothetical protein
MARPAASSGDVDLPIIYPRAGLWSTDARLEFTSYTTAAYRPTLSKNFAKKQTLRQKTNDITSDFWRNSMRIQALTAKETALLCPRTTKV